MRKLQAFLTLCTHCRLFLSTVLALSGGSLVSAASTIGASEMLHRSSGAVSGSNVTLAENGYVGTYLELETDQTVELSVEAYGVVGLGERPRMNIVVADYKPGWDVESVSSSYTTELDLAAGTYFVRVELANAAIDQSRTLTVKSLSTSAGLIVNPTDVATQNAMALAASDTYIEHFRKGSAKVAIPGVAPGTMVSVTQVGHAFRFGTEVPGFSTAESVNALMGENPEPGSDAEKYQQRLLRHFNSVTPGNAGKWDSNEFNQDVITMGGVDRIMEFANDRDMRVRQHAMIWGTQQPPYIVAMTAEAALPSLAGDAAREDLMLEIQQRIDYYVRDRATLFDQLDVYNESYHTGAFIPAATYWHIYGPDGVAGIYNDVAAAAESGGSANTLLFTNEYNVFNDNGDGYCGWYRQHIEEVLNEGGQVGGIGIQYYSYEQIGPASGPHSVNRILGTLQHLSVLGLPIELTEFGIKDNGSGTDQERQDIRSQILDETMRLVYGHAGATGFTIWGFWAGDVWDQAPNAYMYDLEWNLTQAGQAYIDLVEGAWTTVTTVPVAADGTISFDGFYGDYVIEAGGTAVEFTFEKGMQAPFADLAIADSDIQISGTGNGKSILITATLHNIGPAAAANVPVRFTDNGTPIDSDVTIDLIESGSSATATILMSTKHKSGLRAIEVIVDPASVIAELDESNNAANASVFISGNNGNGNGN